MDSMKACHETTLNRIRLFDCAVFSACLLGVVVAAGCSSDSTDSKPNYAGPSAGKTGTPQAGRTGAGTTATAGTTGTAGTPGAPGASGSGGKSVVGAAGMSTAVAGTSA